MEIPSKFNARYCYHFAHSFISQPILNGVYCLALKEEGPGGGGGGGAGEGEVSGEGDRFVLLLL